MILPLVLLALLASMLQTLTYPVREGVWARGREVRKTGEWIREHAGERPVILGSAPEVAFYAGTDRFFHLPDESLERVLEHGRRWNVDYWVIEEHRAFWRTGLKALLEIKNVPPELTLVYRSDRNGARIRVYRAQGLGADGSAGPEGGPP